MPRVYRKEAEWQSLIDQQQASGMAVSQFCSIHSINYVSFCKWRQRLKINNEPPSSKAQADSFVDVSSLLSSSAQQAPSWQITLSLGDGIELTLVRS